MSDEERVCACCSVGEVPGIGVEMATGGLDRLVAEDSLIVDNTPPNGVEPQIIVRDTRDPATAPIGLIDNETGAEASGKIEPSESEISES